MDSKTVSIVAAVFILIVGGMAYSRLSTPPPQPAPAPPAADVLPPRPSDAAKSGGRPAPQRKGAQTQGAAAAPAAAPVDAAQPSGEPSLSGSAQPAPKAARPSGAPAEVESEAEKEYKSEHSREQRSKQSAVDRANRRVTPGGPNR